MICTNCGAENKNNANFCCKCGSRIEQTGQKDNQNHVANKKSKKIWLVIGAVIIIAAFIALRDRGPRGAYYEYSVNYGISENRGIEFRSNKIYDVPTGDLLCSYTYEDGVIKVYGRDGIIYYDTYDKYADMVYIEGRVYVKKK